MRNESTISESQNRLRGYLRSYIDQTGVKQQDVAKSIKCTPSTISMFLKCRRGLDERLVVALTRYLGISLGAIYDPSEQDALPLRLMACMAKLRQLHESSPEGFDNVCSGVDAWLVAASIKNNKRKGAD